MLSADTLEVAFLPEKCCRIARTCTCRLIPVIDASNLLDPVSDSDPVSRVDPRSDEDAGSDTEHAL